MTRALFWNIQTFGTNKFFDASRKRKRGIGGQTPQQAAIGRLALFDQVINAAQPEIVVIIEVGSGDTGIAAGLATQTGGMIGMVALQNHLNRPVPAGGWGAGAWGQVPPLQVGTGGRAETVGVLYQRQNAAGTLRYFTGPNIWTGATSAVPIAGAVPAAYPAGGAPGAINLNAMLVPPGTAVRAIPPGALHNAGQQEDRVAARTSFQSVAPAGPIAYGGLREPYMVTFTEASAAGAVQRNLTIFGIHSPPQGFAAAAYMANLGNTLEIASPLGANETRVVGGDFNLNLLAANGAPSGAYAALTPPNKNYRLLVEPTAAGAPANLEQYKGYFSTHIRRSKNSVASRFLWSESAMNQSFYPGYGYVGSDFVAAPFYAIDNILVWPHQGAPYNYQTTIMNPVTGTPFNAVAPADAPPQGTLAMANGFNNPPPAPAVWPPAPAAPISQNQGARRRLTGWNNFGRIRSTSDHFAVYATV